MTCAKKVVKCYIVVATIKDGYHKFEGTNECRKPVKQCPRAPGEGYEKCKSICDQQGHAEEIALQKALKSGLDLSKATVYIQGIDNVCKDCQLKMYAAGIRRWEFIE